jgi:hypothetical protein
MPSGVLRFPVPCLPDESVERKTVRDPFPRVASMRRNIPRHDHAPEVSMAVLVWDPAQGGPATGELLPTDNEGDAVCAFAARSAGSRFLDHGDTSADLVTLCCRAAGVDTVWKLERKWLPYYNASLTSSTRSPEQETRSCSKKD